MRSITTKEIALGRHGGRKNYHQNEFGAGRERPLCLCLQTRRLRQHAGHNTRYHMYGESKKTLRISMAPSLVSFVCLCALFSGSADAFVAPLSTSRVASLSTPSSSTTSSSALQQREDSGGACSGSWDNRSGGSSRKCREQLVRYASSSRINGADVSQDLSQINGAETAPPVETRGGQARVRFLRDIK